MAEFAQKHKEDFLAWLKKEDAKSGKQKVRLEELADYLMTFGEVVTRHTIQQKNGWTEEEAQRHIHELNEKAVRYSKGFEFRFGFYANPPKHLHAKQAALDKRKQGYFLYVWKAAPEAAQEAPTVKREAALMGKFWEPLLKVKEEIRYCYSSPLFWTDKGRKRFIRHLQLNDDQNNEMKEGGWVPSYHYLSAGEMVAFFRINLTLMHFGVEARRIVEPQLHTEPLVEAQTQPLAAHVIAVGNPRTHQVIDRLNNPDAKWKLSDGDVLDLTNSSRPIKKDRKHEYALVTRSRHKQLKQDCWLYTIESHHGRAVEGAVRFLASERQWEKLADQEEKLEDGYQILLRVELHPEDGSANGFEVMEIHPMVHHSYQENLSTAALKKRRQRSVKAAKGLLAIGAAQAARAKQAVRPMHQGKKPNSRAQSS